MAVSLATQRKNFIFKESTRFLPVYRHEIHGADKLLEIFDMFIFQLRHFNKLDSDGAATTNGICLHGPSGTGKTFFSRYLATESGACFVNMREFPRPLVYKRIVALAPEDISMQFKLARQFIKKYRRPVILFYDEMPDDESKVDEFLMEQLRMEMDGITGRTNGIMLVITTTAEDPEEIDPGLFRDKRVSWHIPFTTPTLKGREAILRYYLNKKKCEKDIDVSSINALFTMDTTPAAIAQYVDDAYIAVLQSAESIGAPKKNVVLTEDHLVQTIIPRLAGFFTDDALTDSEKRRVEFHEAGHAYMGLVIGLPVQVASVYRVVGKENSSHGQTIILFQDDKQMTIRDFQNRLIIAYGGMAAEKLCGFLPSTGMSGDLQNINSFACSLVDQLAQGKRLHAEYGTMQIEKNTLYSPQVLDARDKDIAEIMKDAEREAECIAQKGLEGIKIIAHMLREKKILLQSELERCFHGMITSRGDL